LSTDEDHIVYEGGAFPCEAEAQKVLDAWAAEGRLEPTAINIIPVYERFEDWAADR
jgi:hypothetical protein